MPSIDPFLHWLTQFALTAHLGVFVIVGSFIEEMISLIPSPFIMSTAALASQVQHFTVMQLSVLIVVASAAKALSSFWVYIWTANAEKMILGKWGSYLGLNYAKVEKISSYLTGTWWDDVLLFLSRALPFVPTGLISAGAGAIQYPPVAFILVTFVGCIARNALYVIATLYGWTQVETFLAQAQGNPITLSLFFGGSAALVFILWKAKVLLAARLFATKE